MTRLYRVKRVFWFFSELVKDGPIVFERSKSAHVAKTFQLETDLVKRIKARFRCELSFGGDGK